MKMLSMTLKLALTVCVVAASAFLIAPASAQNKKPAGDSGVKYVFVNNTHGKWTDEQIFWTFQEDGSNWKSLKEAPTVMCPNKNGRVYFYVGAKPKDYYDRGAYWDFIEYVANGNKWAGNTTQVDAWSLPITIEMGNHKVGVNESRKKMFEAFAKDCPPEFKGCIKGDFYIVSPAHEGGMEKGGKFANYFDKYVDEVWDMYKEEKKTPSGKFTGKVEGGALIFTPVGGGKQIVCKSKPSTQDILLGEGVLQPNPGFCGAFNRHVAADPADWRDKSKFYQELPCNWYAKFCHEHAIDHRSYGFCYDDASEQASYFAATGDTCTVVIGWDEVDVKPAK